MTRARYRILSLTALGWLTLAAHGGDAKVLLAHTMPWYESPAFRGFWGKHWTGFQNQHDPNQTGPGGLPDIWSNYHPLIGPYDSADPDVLECQLLQMKLAGIDGVIADWFGTSSAADYPLIHQATQALFSEAAAFGMKFAACFEDRTVEHLVSTGQLQPSGVTGHLINTFLWTQNNWFTAPHYARRDGRPLLLNFGPIYVTDAAPWDSAFALLPQRPAFFPLHHLWGGVNADGGFNWVHWTPWDGNPSEATVRQRLTAVFNATSTDPARVIPSAVAGFDDVYEPGGSFPFLDHRGGDTLRVMLDVGMDGPWSTIQLVTWNDYGEGTMIEPTHEFGYTFLEVIQEARRDEPGSAFAFTADDLRLPALLFSLRKSGGAPPATLDQISDHLNAGETDLARAVLAAILGDIFESQPADTLVQAGGTLVFTAPVTAGLEGVVLRWERDGVVLADSARVSGSATDTLVITGCGRADAGLYRCVAAIAGVDAESSGAIGAVRQSPLGIADYNGDAQVDGLDLLAFLIDLAAALP